MTGKPAPTSYRQALEDLLTYAKAAREVCDNEGIGPSSDDPIYVAIATLADPQPDTSDIPEATAADFARGKVRTLLVDGPKPLPWQPIALLGTLYNDERVLARCADGRAMVFIVAMLRQAMLAPDHLAFPAVAFLRFEGTWRE